MSANPIYLVKIFSQTSNLKIGKIKIFELEKLCFIKVFKQK